MFQIIFSIKMSVLEFAKLMIPVYLFLLLCMPFPLFQLTKLHQLAMQQSPFQIAHSNQGFQGRKTDCV